MHSPSNLPDDWNCWFRRCDLCGSRYHASEGECGCLDNLESCQCGECDWNNEGDNEAPEFVCMKCNTGPWKWTGNYRTVHTARKDHADGKIKAVQQYERIVDRGYFPGGAWKLWIRKRVIGEEPLWESKGGILYKDGKPVIGREVGHV